MRLSAAAGIRHLGGKGAEPCGSKELHLSTGISFHPARVPLDRSTCLCYIIDQVIFFLANTALRARIDQRTKEEAAVVPATIGLTVSDAFRLMMMRIAKDKALPFEPLVPNAETGEAMRAARRNKVMSAGTPDKLLSSVSVND